MSVKISSLNTASTINSGDDINIAGNNPLTFSDWGGGWFMQDGTYIRSLNQKSIWLGDGVLASNGGLSVGYGGTLPTAGYAIIAGNVGIGTSDPQKVLDVAIGANNFVTVGAVTSMGIGQWAGIHFGYRENNALYRKSAIVFERTDNAGGGGNAAGKIYILNGPGIGAGSATLADAKLTIDEYGKVGIGTTTPGYLLDVNGSVRSQGIINIQNGYYENKTLVIGAGDTKYLYVDIQNSYGNVEVLVSGYASGGSASCLVSWIDGGHGGGTSYHRVIQLARQTQGNPVLGNLIKTGGGGSISIQNTGGSPIELHVTIKSYGQNSYAANAYLSSTAPSGDNQSILNIDDINSRVGIGTTSPTTLLDINGAVRVRGNNQIYFDTTGGTSSNYIGITNDYWTTIYCGRGNNSRIDLTNGTGILFSESGTERMRIASGGNVLIGTTTDAGYKLTIAGNSNSYSVSPHAAGIDIYSTGNIAPHYQTTYTWYTGLIGAGVFRMGLDASGNLTAGSFIKSGGTSSQFLKADGSVDSSAYITSAALSGYLPLTGGAMTGNITSNSQISTTSVIFTTGSGYIEGGGMKLQSNYVQATAASGGFYNTFHNVRFYPSSGTVWNITGATFGGTEGTLRFLDSYNAGLGTVKAQVFWTTSNLGFKNDTDWVIKANQGASYGGTLYGAWNVTTNLTVTGDVIGNVRVTGQGIVINKDYIYDSAFIGYASSAVPDPSSETWGAGMFYDADYESSYFGINFADSINTFRLYESGNILFRGGVFAMNENGSFTTTSIKLGAGSAGAATNNWYINKSNSAGYSIVKNTTTLYSINTSGTHSFYSSTPTLLASITASGTTFGGTAGDYNRAYFHVTNTVGATISMFGATYPISLVANYPGVYYNMYYNAGYRIAGGTSVYGSANTFDPINGVFFWYMSNTAANIDVAVTPTLNMRLSRDGRLSLPATLGTGTVYSSTINSIAGTLTNSAPSDLRLKEDVKPLEYGLKEIIALDPVRFKWKDGSNNGEEQIGLIAQDVQEVMPDVVKQIAKEYDFLGLDSSAINIVLINAIKELKAEIEILKNK